MEPCLNLESLTYDGIGDFISSAVEKSETAPWAKPPPMSTLPWPSAESPVRWPRSSALSLSFMLA